jgi:hypothetical protein
MNTDKATPELFTALAKAQAEVENASKNSANPHFKSKYADLAEVLNTVRPVFAKHGLSILQSTEFDGATVNVTTALCHSSGGVVTSTASCVPAKSDAQGIGSATTYLRRYSLAAMTGVAQEDDDGQSAAHAEKPRPISADESAKVAEWLQSIHECKDPDALEQIGGGIASSSLSGAAKAKLRAAFSAHKSKLTKKAA